MAHKIKKGKKKIKSGRVPIPEGPVTTVEEILENRALRDQFLTYVAGGDSILDASKRAGMPRFIDLVKAMAADRDFEMEFVQARRIRAHQLFDETVDIADVPLAGECYVDKHGNVKTNWEAVGRSKLRVEVRQHAAARLMPEMYGEKVQGELNLNHKTSFDAIAQKALEEEARERG